LRPSGMEHSSCRQNEEAQVQDEGTQLGDSIQSRIISSIQAER